MLNLMHNNKKIISFNLLVHYYATRCLRVCTFYQKASSQKLHSTAKALNENKF